MRLPVTKLQTRWAAQVTPDKVYLNGVLVAERPNANAGFAYVPLTGAARAALRPGRNVLAVHAHQTRGGQFIDVGIADVTDPARAK